MDVGVELELLGPVMEDGHESRRGADEAAVAGELDDRLAGRRHQCAIAVSLIGAEDGAEILGDGDRDVEERGREELGLAALDPGRRLVGMAFWATPVLAGVVREDRDRWSWHVLRTLRS